MPPIPFTNNETCHSLPGRVRRSGGFSVVELMMVILILGMVAAIAVPKFSRGSKAAEDASLANNLQTMRRAIEMYHAEHNRYPTLASIQEQLTQYTDVTGSVFPTKSRPDLLGPYLRVFPSRKNRSVAKVAASDVTNADWVYDETTGAIRATANGSDDTSKPYADY